MAKVRTTLNLDEELLRSAREYSGIQEKTALTDSRGVAGIDFTRSRAAPHRPRRHDAQGAGGTSPSIRKNPMTLVYTSVWINHFRKPETVLVQLLTNGMAGIHPYVIGELACGTLKDRVATLSLLRALPQAPVANETEIYYLLDTYRLWGTGLGWVDLHLLTSAAVAGWRLMTADDALNKAAAKAGIPH
jgi:predicted nucleic acid-binding protein